jgi:AcrR family transcriptional regulator
MPRPKTTTKSEQTRAHIFETAKRLFRAKGFQNTTLRSIADEADVALGLSYRYFPQKQDLALALYLELAEQLETENRHAKPAPLADGFATAMRKKLRLITPHREAIAALFAASLTNPGAVSVVGASAAPVRERVRAVFARVVEQATDLTGLDSAERQSLASVLYGVHLVVVLAWLVDPRGSAAAYVGASKDVLARAVPFLSLPPARQALAQVARSLDSFLENAS